MEVFTAQLAVVERCSPAVLLALASSLAMGTLALPLGAGAGVGRRQGEVVLLDDSKHEFSSAARRNYTALALELAKLDAQEGMAKLEREDPFGVMDPQSFRCEPLLAPGGACQHIGL